MLNTYLWGERIGKNLTHKASALPAIANKFGIYGKKSGSFEQLTISTEQLKSVEFIDQNPIGKSSRSNPVTYIKAFDDIRNLFAGLPLSKSRNYKKVAFSLLMLMVEDASIAMVKEK